MKKKKILLIIVAVLVVALSLANIINIKKKQAEWEEEQAALQEQLDAENELKEEEKLEEEDEVELEVESEEEVEEEPVVEEPVVEEESEVEVKEEPEIEEPEPEAEVETEPEEPASPKVEAIPGQHRDPNTAVVVIDPGHQVRGDSTKEPNGPGSSEMKARVTGGATGVSTGVPEYVLNLDVSLKLKAELENRGYTVYMTRSTHDINISNKERAEYASSVGADIAVRIHGNSVDNSGVSGAETLAPSSGNAYVSHLANASQNLSSHIINAYCAATGFNNRGVKTSDTMTGINWSEVPVTILELGFMSNPGEDQAMQDEVMQNNMVQGIANGIDAYFGF